MADRGSWEDEWLADLREEVAEADATHTSMRAAEKAKPFGKVRQTSMSQEPRLVTGEKRGFSAEEVEMLRGVQGVMRGTIELLETMSQREQNKLDALARYKERQYAQRWKLVWISFWVAYGLVTVGAIAICA